MSKSITMDWDGLAQRGGTKKGKKGGAFVSRLTGRTAAEKKKSDSIRRSFAPSLNYEEKKAPQIKETKDGKFYFQINTGKGFGPKMEISASLAAKLQS
jgi:hypothetical protein